LGRLYAKINCFNGEIWGWTTVFETAQRDLRGRVSEGVFGRVAETKTRIKRFSVGSNDGF